MPGTPKSWWSPKQFVYCCAFNHPFAQNILFLTKVILIQGAFKNIQGLLCKIQGLVKSCQGYPTIFQFSRTFQGHHAFSMTFQGPCEPWLRSGIIKQRRSSSVHDIFFFFLNLDMVLRNSAQESSPTFHQVSEQKSLVARAWYDSLYGKFKLSSNNKTKWVNHIINV